MKKFFSEFKKFISRGNVMDMAVGVIIGSAFTAIVNALSNGILKPLINWIIALCSGGNKDALASAYTILSPAYTVDAEGKQVLDLANSIFIDWGGLVSAIINFLLIALVLFIIVRTFNRFKEINQSATERLKNKKKLSPKEKALLEEQAKKEAEEKALAEQKAAEEKALADQKAAEEAKKIADKEAREENTEKLLTEIRDLLKNK